MLVSSYRAPNRLWCVNWQNRSERNKNAARMWNMIVSNKTKLGLTRHFGIWRGLMWILLTSTANFLYLSVCLSGWHSVWIGIWILIEVFRFFSWQKPKPSHTKTSYKWWDELAKTQTVHFNWMVSQFINIGQNDLWWHVNERMIALNFFAMSLSMLHTQIWGQILCRC